MKICGLKEGLLACRKEATRTFGGMEICDTHFRTVSGNRFGQMNTPPWTKEQALYVLVEQHALDEAIARKLVDEFFGSEGSTE
jgi:hypothetical protein